MAEKKKPQPSKAKAKAQADSQKKPGKADPKKIMIVVIVIAVVVAISVFVDYTIRNPRVTSLDEAHNQVTGQRVLADNPEIAFETPVEFAGEQEPVEIGGKQYWKVDLILYYDTPQAKTLVYYVAANNSKIYTMDEATNQLIPYGV